MNEAEALILLPTKTAVPVPKGITAYTIGDIGFILMDKIDGETLGSCWDKISQEQHEAITRELKIYVGEWRKLRSSFLGSVNGGPCEDIIFKHPFDYRAPPKHYGRFHSLQDYQTGVIEALRLSMPDGAWDATAESAKEKIRTFANAESSIIENLGVMTHGDLHEGNIMIDNGSTHRYGSKLD
ncbi:kinase-like domain-containing protein [Penicillium sp. IBT 31633x]|nr:kinase-like domain-containing protein [Penicillium sp. IBT 31633x]